MFLAARQLRLGTGLSAETPCGVTDPEATLLTRSAAARPAWIVEVA